MNQTSTIGRIVRSSHSKKMPILGTIRVGEKVIGKSGKEHPTSLDYFSATGKYAELFHKVYGDKPTVLQIVFVSDDYYTSCYETMEARDAAGRLLCDGDGINWRIYNPISQLYEIVLEETVENIEKRCGKLKEVLTLKFVLPKMPGVFGLWRMSTHGTATSIPAIRDVFDEILERAGTVVNIPFDLHIEKVKSNKPDDERVYPVITMIPNVSQENLDILAEFIQEGVRIKGMLSDDKILSMKHTPQLESHYEVVEEVVEEVLSEVEDSLITKITKEEAKGLWKIAQTTGYIESEAKIVLMKFGYKSFNEISKADMMRLVDWFASKKELEELREANNE